MVRRALYGPLRASAPLDPDVGPVEVFGPALSTVFRPLEELTNTTIRQRRKRDAAEALAAASLAYTQREVLIVEVLDAPGMLGDVALVMADAGINIDSVYVTTAGHAVFGVDDLDGAIQVAGGMAVMTPP